jgi:hypothetical protein
MPAYSIPSNTNLSSQLVAQSADFLPKLWKKGVEISEQAEDYFGEFEGSGSDSPIQSITDLAKGAGQSITFRTMSGLYGDGVQGDEIIGDNAEAFRVGSFSLEVDYLRHATAHNLRTEDQTALISELKAGVPEQLGKWLGRKKTERLQMMFIKSGGVDNTAFANGKGSRDLLKSADTISMDTIISGGQRLKTLGARPAMVNKIGPNKINRFIVVGLGEGLVSLKNSADYRQALNLAGVRGDENPIFSGGYVDVNGHVIREFNPLDHDGFGAVGSAMNPKAYLGAAITNPTAGFNIFGGGNSTAAAVKARYFEFFSNYAYRFTPSNQLAADSTQRYLLIVNLTGANAGKYGFYGFTGNGLDANGFNVLTVNKMLIPSTGTADSFKVKSLGLVTPTANGPWDDAKITNSHPEGSMILECNAAGVPIGRSLILGANAAVRGYGRFRNERTEEKLDGEFLKKTYITSVFGQSPYKRVDGRFPNYLVVEHAMPYAGIPLPLIA